jgi:hypothetical protein
MSSSSPPGRTPYPATCRLQHKFSATRCGTFRASIINVDNNAIKVDNNSMGRKPGRPKMERAVRLKRILRFRVNESTYQKLVSISTSEQRALPDVLRSAAEFYIESKTVRTEERSDK